MIKNIILDMGNVLLDFNPRKAVELFFDTEEDKQLIIKELFHGPEWGAGDYGTITNEERYDLVKERVPVNLHGRLQQCVREWFITMTPLPGADEFIHKIKEAGYSIYILSNACNGFYEYFPKFCPLDFFDGVVVSSDLHIVKPDPRIYEYIMQKYNLKPKECLFMDDREDNVAAAINAGMLGYVFPGAYQEEMFTELLQVK